MSTAPTADTRPDIDAALVRRLVDSQFPQWAGLPLKLLDPAGSDHVIYRLGECIRDSPSPSPGHPDAGRGG